MSLSPERRRQLQELGLRALVKRRFGDEVTGSAHPVPFGGGAAIVTAPAARAGASGTQVLVAVFADSPSGLGAAVDLAARQGADHLYFFAEDNSAAVARRAAEFAVPITVVDPDGDFEALEPDEDPLPGCAPPPAALAGAGARMAAAGLEVVWEGGTLRGEWLGLEVARATVDPEAEDGVAFVVGVGRHDREANLTLYPFGPPDSFLDQAVARVRELRRPGATPHPANQLAPERWLRAVLGRHPDLAGLAELHPGPAPEPRPDLRHRAVAPAWARVAPAAADRPAAPAPVVVVCSVGVDPDLIAQAAAARRQAPGWPDYPVEDADPALIVVVPEGDDHPLSRRLAALLRRPGEVVTVPESWRSVGE